tara:strand:- start:1844 stop:2074 length:231 start_codon:yes stop_codon:yes gene_type:complete
MNKLITVIILICFFTYNSANAEENKCENIKKMSREYLKCKTGNLNKSVNKNANKLKKGFKNIGNKLKDKVKGISNK